MDRKKVKSGSAIFPPEIIANILSYVKHGCVNIFCSPGTKCNWKTVSSVNSKWRDIAFKMLPIGILYLDRFEHFCGISEASATYLFSLIDFKRITSVHFRTLINSACNSGHTNLIFKFRDAEPKMFKSCAQRTLETSTLLGNFDVVDYILTNRGEDEDLDLGFAIHWAVDHDMHIVLERLVKDPVTGTVYNFGQRSLFWDAIKFNSLNALKVLLRNVTKTARFNIPEMISHAAFYNRREAVEILLKEDFTTDPNSKEVKDAIRWANEIPELRAILSTDKRYQF